MTETFHARAEAWECDFNGHWNTRFYCKAFQTAAAVADHIGGLPPVSTPQRHLRFHAEMHSGDPLSIRSYDVTGGATPMTAHVMYCYDKMVATALDTGIARNPALTPLSIEEAKHILPRGLTTPVTPVWHPDPSCDLIYELGPVTADDLHADGTILPWLGVARFANGSHHHDLTVGFTLEIMREQNIGRMLAEMRCTRLEPLQPGDFLRCTSRMTTAKGKAFTTAHMLTTHRGTPVAMYDLCTLAVDMKERRAMDLPAFVHDWMARFA